MNDGTNDLSDEALGRRLATELPRHHAPARVRAAVGETATPRPRRAVWVAPALAAAATALALIMFFIPLLPRVAPTDPTLRLTRAVIAEHSRALMWGARRPEIIPASLPRLTQETGITLTRVFVGDDHLTLLGAEPVYLDQRRGLAVHYRDADGHHVTYVVLPVPGLGLPERARVKLDRWRPALLHDNGFSAWVWRQGDLACFLVAAMVSETDIVRFKDYFIRVRSSTEPVPAH